MPSSDRRLRAVAARSVRHLTNRRVDARGWERTACRTFGSPWLELVVRAGRANATVHAAAATSHVELIDHATERVWTLSELAQDHHRRSAPLRDPDHAAILGAAHARISRLVDELEQAAATFHRARLSDDLERSMPDLDDLADRIRATAAATSELDRL